MLSSALLFTIAFASQNGNPGREYHLSRVHYFNGGEEFQGMHKHYTNDDYTQASFEFLYHSRMFPKQKDYEFHAQGHGEYHGSLIYDGIKEYKTHIKCHHHVFVADAQYNKRDAYNKTSTYCDCLFENGITKCDRSQEPFLSHNSGKIVMGFKLPLKISKKQGKNSIQKRSTDWYMFVYAWLWENHIDCYEDLPREAITLPMSDIFSRMFRNGGEGVCARIFRRDSEGGPVCAPIPLMLIIHSLPSIVDVPYYWDVPKKFHGEGPWRTKFYCQDGTRRNRGMPW